MKSSPHGEADIIITLDRPDISPSPSLIPTGDINSPLPLASEGVGLHFSARRSEEGGGEKRRENPFPLTHNLACPPWFTFPQSTSCLRPPAGLMIGHHLSHVFTRSSLKRVDYKSQVAVFLNRYSPPLSPPLSRPKIRGEQGRLQLPSGSAPAGEEFPYYRRERCPR